MSKNFVLYLRTVYYFTLYPFFVKILGIIFLYKRNDKESLHLENVKKILIVKTDEIGDVVLCSAFLRELRRNIPNAEISIIVKYQNYDIIEFCPYIENKFKINLRFNKIFRVFQQYYRMYILGKKFLWKERYDLAILPRWDGDDHYNDFITYFSGAKFRMGYNQKDGSEKLLNIPVEKADVEHEVLKTLSLIKHIGGKVIDDKLEFWLSEKDNEYAEKVFEIYNLRTRYLLTISPGAALDKRRWPKENFKELAKKILDELKDEVNIILLGSKDETYIGEYISIDENKIINLIGKTTIRQAAALIAHSNLFLGNDSGLMHVAAAVSTPVIEISSFPENGDNNYANSPIRFRPLGK